MMEKVGNMSELFAEGMMTPKMFEKTCPIHANASHLFMANLKSYLNLKTLLL